MSTFSWSRPNDRLGQSLQSQPQPLQTASVNASPVVTEQLQKLKDAFDPGSQACQFTHYFYNKVPEDQAVLYTKPPAQDQAKWDQAIQNRPDSSSVPVLAVGFTDLQKRTQLQQAQVAAYRARMHEINAKLKQLTDRHDLHTTVKTVEMNARHAKLVQRTLALAARLQVLHNRGYVLRPDEEALKHRLTEMMGQIDDPAVFGRINEIWARMSMLRDRAADSGGHSVRQLDWERDDEQLERIAKVLKAQQTGIAYMASVLQADMAEVEKMSRH